MSEQKLYRVVQTRHVDVAAVEASNAKAQGVKEFNAYCIADNPAVKDGEVLVQTPVVEHLPMQLNLGSLGDIQSVIGWANLYKDELTGEYRLEIRMMNHASSLMDNLVEIAHIKAIGFAGILKKPEA